jgi:hypothetical protein
VVRKAWVQMLLLVYAAVIVLCFITFRSWRAVVVAVVPLVITSVLCEALMVALGIGVKVATLPVIALGVGIGVDYALYLLSVQLAQQRQGVPLALAYKRALEFTGRVVVLVGVTLAGRRGDLGLLAHQVPGRHGHPAGVHVPVEHGRRRGADVPALSNVQVFPHQLRLEPVGRPGHRDGRPHRRDRRDVRPAAGSGKGREAARCRRHQAFRETWAAWPTSCAAWPKRTRRAAA